MIKGLTFATLVGLSNHAAQPAEINNITLGQCMPDCAVCDSTVHVVAITDLSKLSKVSIINVPWQPSGNYINSAVEWKIIDSDVKSEK